jgi:hypothetical protein
MNLQEQNQSSEMILRRIDAIIRELELLRTLVIASETQQPAEDLTQKLFGVLGRGNWEEYDLNLDWQRFEA